MKILGKRVALTTIIIVIFAGVFLWGRFADAAEARMGLGFGTFNSQGIKTQDLMLTSTGRRWYAGVSRWGSRKVDEFPDLTRFVAGYRVNWRRDARVSPYMRLGMAYFTAEPTYWISDRTAFDLAIGLRLYNTVEIEIGHNSTGGRTDRNKGLDLLLPVSVIFPFGASK